MQGVRWLRGDLQAVDGLQPRVDAIFSCGPLDHFARWYAQSLVECPRVVAFGSTSVEVKQDSADAAERDLAMRLREGEAGVLAAASARNAAATLLRPTLVYGAAGDRTLTRIATMAARWHRFALPRNANGLRQRSEEHTSELKSLMRNSYAVFCLKKKKNTPELHLRMRNSNFDYSSHRTMPSSHN